MATTNAHQFEMLSIHVDKIPNTIMGAKHIIILTNTLKYIAIMLLFQPFVLLAQKTDSLILEEITLFYDRINYASVGKNVTILDSVLVNYNHTSLADLLMEQSLSYMKINSNGGLASVSLRGAGSTHTKVLWNGISINNAKDGIYDMNTLPTNFVSGISVQQGASAALWGSGAIGGIINLKNNISFQPNNSTTISLQYGSFENKRVDVMQKFSTKKIYIALSAYLQEVDNDYKFKNELILNMPIQKLLHSDFNRRGVLTEIGFKINKSSQVNVFVWGHENYKNSLNSIVDLSSYNYTKTNHLYTLAIYKIEKEKFLSHNKIFFSESKLLYHSDISSTQSSVYQTQLETDNVFKITKNHELNFGLNHNIAYTQQYSSPLTQNRISLFVAYKYKSTNKKIVALASARTEKIFNHQTDANGTQSYSSNVFYMGVDYNFNPNFWFKANISKVYAAPTFEDLYSVYGGNPNLKPEHGYSGEWSLLYKQKQTSVSLTYFNTWMENRIVWAPIVYGSFLYQPQNINQVWSRGIELDINHQLDIAYHLSWNNNIKGTYTISTLLSTYEDNKFNVGNDLEYSPRMKIIFNSGLHFKDFYIMVNYNYVGIAYSDRSNENIVNPFHLLNLSVNRNFNLFKTKLLIYAKINNVLNQQYQIIKDYPMPMMNFNVGLKTTFNW